MADIAKSQNLPLEAVRSEERIIFKMFLDPPLQLIRNLAVVTSRTGILDVRGGTDEAIQVPASMAAFFQSLNILIGIPSGLETSALVWFPLLSMVRAAIFVELLCCGAVLLGVSSDMAK